MNGAWYVAVGGGNIVELFDILYEMYVASQNYRYAQACLIFSSLE